MFRLRSGEPESGKDKKVKSFLGTECSRVRGGKHPSMFLYSVSGWLESTRGGAGWRQKKLHEVSAVQVFVGSLSRLTRSLCASGPGSDPRVGLFRTRAPGATPSAASETSRGR